MLRIDSFYDFHFEDEIAVEASPAAAFGFFEAMEANYVRWHPDHRRFEWRKGRGIAVGNVFWFEEVIGGNTLRKEVRITQVVPDRYFAFTMVNPLMRFFLPRLSFGFEPRNGGCLFRAELHLHGIGPIGRRLNKREFDVVDVHMVEEGRNLKRLLEA
ncbi:MAG TPA: SRPBCC family protein [Devosia sp.]